MYKRQGDPADGDDILNNVDNSALGGDIVESSTENPSLEEDSGLIEDDGDDQSDGDLSETEEPQEPDGEETTDDSTLGNTDEGDTDSDEGTEDVYKRQTVSCAYVKPTQSGGIKVRTANLNWVTCNMIATSLSTSCLLYTSDPSTISKEIRRHSIIRERSADAFAPIPCANNYDSSKPRTRCV